MTDFSSSETFDAAPLASFLVCDRCQTPRRIHMKTPVALADGVCTVTLVCDPCGTARIEVCTDDEQ